MFFNHTYNTITYENCVSLGWFCGTASSMALHGFRACSGPFDWFFSDLPSVLKIIEKNFEDFMIKENLVVSPNKPHEFTDRKYGFRCPHDIKNNLTQDYSRIYEKYHRRASNFMNKITLPTCFIRAVRNEEEITYIRENIDYIYSVIRRANSKNQIIFLLLENMNSLPHNLLSFRLNINTYATKTYEMLTMFDSSPDFLNWCKSNIKYSPSYINAKILNDYKASYIFHKIEQNDNRIVTILNDCYFDINPRLYLWGAGFTCSFILEYLNNHQIKVNSIIDNDVSKHGMFLNGLPIISFSEITDQNINILITTISGTDNIINQIKKICPAAVILTLVDLYNILFPSE
ncbi:MAG: hypothetical protein IJP31_04020 [Lachnospiraceae bacterium]|nr:hypothetical protein [Lachnospiraceae bacterium]